MEIFPFSLVARITAIHDSPTSPWPVVDYYDELPEFDETISETCGVSGITMSGTGPGIQTTTSYTVAFAFATALTNLEILFEEEVDLKRARELYL